MVHGLLEKPLVPVCGGLAWQCVYSMQTDKTMLQKGVLDLFMWARVRCSMVAVCTHGGF